MSSDDINFSFSTNYEQIEVPPDMHYLDIVQMLNDRSRRSNTQQEQHQEPAAVIQNE